MRAVPAIAAAFAAAMASAKEVVEMEAEWAAVVWAMAVRVAAERVVGAREDLQAPTRKRPHQTRSSARGM